jgi:hypothetical protein
MPWQRIAPPSTEIWKEGCQSGTHMRRRQVVRLNLCQQHGDYSLFPKGFIRHSAIYLRGTGLKSSEKAAGLPGTSAGKYRIGATRFPESGGFPPFQCPNIDGFAG